MVTKRAAVAIVATLGITGLLIAQNVFSIQRLERTLDQQSAEVAQAYVRLTQTSVTELLQQPNLSRGQRDALELAKERALLAKAAKTLPERIARTVAVREALVAALGVLPVSTQLGATQPAHALRREMSEASIIRPLLDEYNQSAKTWNDRMASQVHGLTASLAGSEPRLYPLLRFDGEQESKTIIEL